MTRFICLASLRDHISSLLVVQCLQTLVLYVFSSSFHLVYSRRASLLPHALSYLEVKVYLFLVE